MVDPAKTVFAAFKQVVTICRSGETPPARTVTPKYFRVSILHPSLNMRVPLAFKNQDIALATRNGSLLCVLPGTDIELVCKCSLVRFDTQLLQIIFSYDKSGLEIVLTFGD